MKQLFAQAKGRTAVLIVFVGVCALVFGWLVSGTGVTRPGLDDDQYTATLVVKDADNIVHASQVQVAGVKVGTVRSVEQVDGGVAIEIALDDQVAPLHDGVKVRVGERSLVGETYLDVQDGDGREISSGTELPASAVLPSVQLRDVLADLDPGTRTKLGRLLRSMGQATKGTGQDVASLLAGLGQLGRQGHTALDAIAAQSEDLTELARSTAAVLEALDTGQGQLATLVRDANDLTGATSGQREAIEQTLRTAPSVLDSAREATDSLSDVAVALAPVADDLRSAAPHLATALAELPGTTTDLRGMLAPLSDVLAQAPATLTRIPRTSRELSALAPTARLTLSDVNPMLAYIEPYGPELAAYFANFNAVLNYKDENGASYLRLTPLANTHSPQLPFSTDGLIGNYTNAYPPPGAGATPGPFKGEYPRIKRQER